MATPIAHKGATQGAKVVAATVIDLLTDAALREAAWTYFREEQLQGQTYEAFVGPDDEPAIEKNAAIMAEFRERLSKFYYDSSRYSTYLEQLGVEYPVLQAPEEE